VRLPFEGAQVARIPSPSGQPKLICRKKHLTRQSARGIGLIPPSCHGDAGCFEPSDEERTYIAVAGVSTPAAFGSRPWSRARPSAAAPMIKDETV
jgi:hypothetical protein